MIRNLLIAVLMSFIASASFAFTVDTSKSKVTWRGTKVTGEHTGNVKIKEANLNWKEGELTGGTIIIDMTTITNTDIESDEYNKKLVGHLKSDDFFGVDKHKTAKLEITKVTKKSDKSYVLSGKLNIKGKTDTVTVNANVTKAGKSSKMVNAKFSFDRTKFDIKYKSGKFFPDLGDKLIHDKVEVAVDLHLKQAGA